MVIYLLVTTSFLKTTGKVISIIFNFYSNVCIILYRRFATTQFQIKHARTAFPCYDEPYFRTPFNISIKIKRNEIAKSNMPISYINDV